MKGTDQPLTAAKPENTPEVFISNKETMQEKITETCHKRSKSYLENLKDGTRIYKQQPIPD